MVLDMKKRNVLILGGLTTVGVVVVVAVSASGGSPTPAPKNTSVVQTHKSPSRENPQPSQKQLFIECVNKTGLPSEKAAVDHVTKVRSEGGSYLDSAEIYTDFNGDLFSPEANTAKLIASAYASCYHTDSGAGL